MATPWDRAAEGYLQEWVPRFVPYHLDLVRELALLPGQRVLVTSCGPGAEALAAARAVGANGRVRATDKSAEMVRICAESAKRGGLTSVECVVADAASTAGAPWDAIMCAFGLWQLSDRPSVIREWAGALSERGKVGVVTWGPPEADDPFEQLSACLTDLEPRYRAPRPQVEAERDRMGQMFEEGGLVMIRHTVVHHTLSFPSAEGFVRAMREASTWRAIWEEIGAARFDRVAAKFYGIAGGPDAPVSFAPPATLAIAALPGAEVELAHRPSVRALQ